MQDPTFAAPARRLSLEDRLTLAMLGFFVFAGFTIELYFVLFHADIRSRDDVFAHLYGIYAAADQAYFHGADDALPVALETLNVFVTQPLYGWLAVAIWKGRPYRHVLQLVVSGYLAYSVVLYFLVAHVSGYAAMPVKSAGAYLLFYGANLPWLVGPLVLVQRSVFALGRATLPG